MSSFTTQLITSLGEFLFNCYKLLIRKCFLIISLISTIKALWLMMCLQFGSICFEKVIWLVLDCMMLNLVLVIGILPCHIWTNLLHPMFGLWVYHFVIFEILDFFWNFEFFWNFNIFEIFEIFEFFEIFEIFENFEILKVLSEFVILIFSLILISLGFIMDCRCSIELGDGMVLLSMLVLCWTVSF